MTRRKLDAVVIIHGIGTQKIGWEKPLLEYIPNDVKVYAFNWFDLLDDAPSAKRIRALSLIANLITSNNPYLMLARPLINAGIKWLLNRAGDVLGYHEIRRRAMQRLRTLLKTIPEQQVGLIAHSMGSILVYEYLNENRNNLEPKIKKFISLGSPLYRNPVKAKVIKRSPYDLDTMKNLPVSWLDIRGKFDIVARWIPYIPGREYLFNPNEQRSEMFGHKLEKYMSTLKIKDFHY